MTSNDRWLIVVWILTTVPLSVMADENSPKGTPVVFEHELAGKLALIPAGEFLMGSPDSDPNVDEAETPRHPVKIALPFYMGVYEVTHGQFRRFVSDTAYVTDAEKDGVGGWGYSSQKFDFERPPETYSWRNTGFPQANDSPVVNVSWQDAVQFCEWLTAKDGTYRFRLPTEAEWEFACRAGTETIWNVGNVASALRESDNILDASAKPLFNPKSPHYQSAEPWFDGFAFTAPVGRFRPNAFGLFDMHGNVAEWCQDIFMMDRYYKPDDFVATLGDSRVFRGGAWIYNAAHSRSARRHRFPPNDRWCNIGFRVVRETVTAAESSDHKLALVPLYRFYDRTLREHIYSYGLGEPPVLRKRAEIAGESVIGYVSLNKERGATRLWRFVMPDGRHYFLHYVKNARSPVEVGEKLREELQKGAIIEEFKVWVWPHRADKRQVPIYGCSMPDGTDMLFSPDKDEIRTAIRDTLNSLGVQRNDHGIAFYLFPDAVED